MLQKMNLAARLVANNFLELDDVDLAKPLQLAPGPRLIFIKEKLWIKIMIMILAITGVIIFDKLYLYPW